MGLDASDSLAVTTIVISLIALVSLLDRLSSNIVGLWKATEDVRHL